MLCVQSEQPKCEKPRKAFRCKFPRYFNSIPFDNLSDQNKSSSDSINKNLSLAWIKYCLKSSYRFYLPGWIYTLSRKSTYILLRGTNALFNTCPRAVELTQSEPAADLLHTCSSAAGLCPFAWKLALRPAMRLTQATSAQLRGRWQQQLADSKQLLCRSDGCRF